MWIVFLGHLHFMMERALSDDEALLDSQASTILNPFNHSELSERLGDFVEKFDSMDDLVVIHIFSFDVQPGDIIFIFS